MVEQRQRTVPEQAIIKMKVWMNLHRLWTTLHFLIGVTGIVLASMVASKPSFFDEEGLNIIAWLSSLFVTLITFLNPSKKAQVYFQAWAILDRACNRYQIDTTVEIKEVITAMESGDRMIGGSEYIFGS